MDDWGPQQAQNTQLRVTGTPGVRRLGFYPPVSHALWDKGYFWGHHLPDISCLLCAWAELAPVGRITGICRRQPLAGRGECPGDMGGALTATDFILLSSSGKEGPVQGSPDCVLLATSPASPFHGHSVPRLCPVTPGQVMPAQKTLMTPRSLQSIIF